MYSLCNSINFIDSADILISQNKYIEALDYYERAFAIDSSEALRVKMSQVAMNSRYYYRKQQDDFNQFKQKGDNFFALSNFEEA